MISYPINSGMRRFVPAKHHRPFFMLRVLVACSALFVYVALAMDFITNFQGLEAYTMLLLGYLYAEAKKLRAQEPYFFWINPVVLASIVTFVMPFGISNAIYFLPESMLDLVGVSPLVTIWMNQLMLLVLLGAICMWTGYSSGLGLNMGTRLQRSRLLRKWMSPSLRINKPALYVSFVISIAAKLFAIKLGVFGYSASYDQLIAAASYTQYFAMADSLGKLALVGAALQCFASRRASPWDLQFLLLVLGNEVIFGFLSGMKSAVGMPFIMVGIVYYSQHNRFPQWLIPAVVASVITAYAVIEPFRAARNADTGFVGTSLVSIVDTMINAPKVVSSIGVEENSKSIEFVARSSMVQIGSLGIEYAANNSELPAGSPEFLGNIILAPAHALIPRFLWESKPLENTGLWYTNQVIGVNAYSSSAMSPFTYLNFAGGPLAVILAFLIVGIFQRGLFDGLRHFGGGGLIVFFGLLGTLVNIDNSFNGFFINIIRYLPILIVVQYVFLQRSRR